MNGVQSYIYFLQFTMMATYCSYHSELPEFYIYVPEPSVRGLRRVPLAERTERAPERALGVLLVERLVDVGDV